jgi:phosphatidylcholine synthase
MKTTMEVSSMIDEPAIFISRRRRVAAWLVHLFTAAGAVLGLLTLNAIHRQQFLTAFWLMAVTIVIDATDGVMARLAMTKEAAPRIDGALLDNLIDYINYVMAPAFFLVVSDLLPHEWRFWGAGLIVLVSAYQFTQTDAKTEDHFFKGFPSYWNIVVFYLFIWHTSPWTNLVILLILSVLVFVPIKYVYPSRLTYLSPNPGVRRAMLLASLVWGGATTGLLWLYPNTNRLLMALSLAYVVLYTVISLYRTFVPVDQKKLTRK